MFNLHYNYKYNGGVIHFPPLCNSGNSVMLAASTWFFNVGFSKYGLEDLKKPLCNAKVPHGMKFA